MFMKDRPVPYSLVEKVEKEYDRLVESDILYPVSSSSWASLVVQYISLNLMDRYEYVGTRKQLMNA